MKIDTNMTLICKLMQLFQKKMLSIGYGHVETRFL